MSLFNILLTSAGRRVALLQNFQTSLQKWQLSGNLLTTDYQCNAPAPFLANQAYQIPRITDPDYISALQSICKEASVHLLIPLLDTELQLLSHHREEFTAIGTQVVVSSPEVNTICFDKRNTYAFFKSHGIATPEVFDLTRLLQDSTTDYPIMVKPAMGSRSIGVTPVYNSRELEFFLDYIPDAIAQEFLVGNEYTIDVLVDFQGVVRCVVPRLRIETRAGEISKGVTVKNPTLIQAATQVVEALPGAVGCITVQCFQLPNGEIKFTEINPRFGGGFPLSYQAGADFPGWLIQWALGQDPEIAIDGWQDDLTMLRYDDAIFISQGQRI